MALMKDYTSVFNIMRLKLGKSAKKSSPNLSKFKSVANFESLLRGLIPVSLRHKHEFTGGFGYEKMPITIISRNCVEGGHIVPPPQ